jgi:integrase
VAELVLAYYKHAEGYYVKDGRPTSELNTLRQALRFVRRLYGATPAHEFGPLALKAVRQAMIDHEITRTVKVRDPRTGKVVKDPVTGADKTEIRVLRHGLARKFINKQVGRIKRMFGWAVEEERLHVSVHQALVRVKGLQKGKTKAREKSRVRPVSVEHVDAVLPFVPAAVRTMIEVQRLTGCRPQDVVQLRDADIDRCGPVWEYRPGRYKTEHHDAEHEWESERVVFLGPKVQSLLAPYFTANSSDYLFSPRNSERQRNEKRRSARRTPMWPSHAEQQAKKRQSRDCAKLNDHYSVTTYRRAVRRACQKVGIPIWHPHQLRHTRLTEIRKQYGLEASKACAGHKEIGVTQHYAKQDQALAHRVMGKIG